MQQKPELVSQEMASVPDVRLHRICQLPETSGKEEAIEHSMGVEGIWEKEEVAGSG